MRREEEEGRKEGRKEGEEIGGESTIIEAPITQS